VLRFDPNAMRDIDHWVRTHGAQLAFLYGQFDPWSALPFHLGAGSRDSYVYTVPGGNHLSGIFTLPAGPQAALIATLQRWAGVPATGAAPTAARGAGRWPRRPCHSSPERHRKIARGW